MVTGSLARRYAKAIFAIGLAQNNLDKLGADLQTLARALKTSVELVDVLSNPAVRRNDRRKVLDALLARNLAQPATKNVVNLLLDHERMASLPAISRELDAMIEAKAGRVAAQVVSAKPLDPAQLSQITASLEKLSGK
jgi:F-type H+-transporting ATPase subunit delta